MTEFTQKALQYRLAIPAGLLALALGCEGAPVASNQAPPSGPLAGGGTSAAPELAEGVGVARVGLRRLTVNEIDNSIRDLLRDDSRPAARFLPEEILPPFDNDYGQQFVSTVLVESIEKVAEDVTLRLLQDVSRRDAVIGCSPADPAAADATCLRQFITEFGRRILRRTMLDDDVNSFQATAEAYIAREHNFYAGIEVALGAFLQHPAFLYRVEAGTPVVAQPGVFKLDDLEVATRLSYLIWGSTPSGHLLDVAQGDGLSSPSKIRDVARTMLDDARASQTMDRFHALWLGYSVLPHEQALATSMRAETSALIARTFMNDEPWTNLFTATDTYVDATLAAIYGLPVPVTGSGWVSYPDAGRRGLLSHGSFLSMAGNYSDTSPTQRGKLIRTRLLCQEIPPPPPNVNNVEPTTSAAGPCKLDRYAAHRTSGTVCAGCHALMDPVGFGLENYDRLGRFRTHDIDADPDSPTYGQLLEQCAIPGEGEVVGLGKFNGPAQLSEVLVAGNVLGPCVAEQFYRFAAGRKKDDTDAAGIEEYKTTFASSGNRFRELVLSLVTSRGFGYRREEPAP
jgi:hypothetical protein